MEKTLPIKTIAKRKIGNTTYIVETRFNPKARETLEQKIVRLTQREIANGTFSAIPEVKRT
jgi:hypothetical protein